MLLLTCEKCQTMYRLDPAFLQHGGRVVRCTSCGNTWFHEGAEGTAPPQSADTPAAEGAEQPEEVSTQEDMRSFRELLQQGEMEPLPASVTPVPQDFHIPVLDHRPGGMSAGQFGLAVFAGLVCLTLCILMLARGPVLRHMPSMAAFYTAAGFDLRAPGEGLQFFDVAATRRRDDKGLTVALNGRLRNISEQTQNYPALIVRLRDGEGRELKDWTMHPGDAKLAPGEIIPLSLSFEDVPESGTALDVRVLAP